MTAVVGVHVHPSVCPCAGMGVVGVSTVGQGRDDMPDQVASRLASVIVCPHCRDRGDLDRFLERSADAPLPGPAGAA